MTKQDYSNFAQMWQGVHNVMQFGKTFDQSMMMFVFDALEDYSLDAIRQAIKIYSKQNSQAPQHSDIIKLISKFTGEIRLSADEAWNEIPKSEDCPCVWTDEMSQAWALVASSYYYGDKIGARMGFKSTYDRLCDESVLFGRSVRWSFSHGAKKDLYKSVTDKAVSQGRLSPQSAQNIMLSAPKPATSGIVGLLTGKIDGDIGKKNAARARELISFLDAEMEKDKKAADEKLKSMQDKRNSVIDEAFNKLAESLSPKELKAVLDAHLSSFEIPTGLVDA